MPITAKGMKDILDLHALDAVTNSDEDVTGVIANSTKASADAKAAADAIANREKQEKLESDRIEKLEGLVAELGRKAKGNEKPIHNRSNAAAPVVDLEADEASEKTATMLLIANRAAELERLTPGISTSQAFMSAAAEIEAKNKK